MELDEAIKLLRKIVALERGRFSEEDGHWTQPLFDARLDSRAFEETRGYRIRVTPSRHLPDGPWPAEWKQLMDLADRGEGKETLEVRLDNAGMELG